MATGTEGIITALTPIILEVLKAAIAFIAFIYGCATGFFKRIFNCIISYSKKKSNCDLVIVRENSMFNTCIWHMGTQGEKPGMQIRGNFLVTNNSTKSLILTSSFLRKSGKVGEASVKELESTCHSFDYPIPPGATTKLSVQFWLVPPIKKSGEILTETVGVSDQFGKKYWLKKVKFTCV